MQSLSSPLRVQSGKGPDVYKVDEKSSESLDEQQMGTVTVNLGGTEARQGRCSGEKCKGVFVLQCTLTSSSGQ